MPDYYEESAEFIDMMIAPWWEGPGGLLSEVLRKTEDAQGPVVDVGAGSGQALGPIRNALGDVDILAVEPSLALRSALFTRVLGEPDLRDRVTVLPCALADADLPDVVRAFTLMNVIGHFSPEDRARLWALAAERLAPTGRVAVNLAPPYSPVPVPSTRMADLTVGRNRYEGWAQAEPAGKDMLTWTMTYVVSGPFGTPRETVVRYGWWTLTPERLADEAAQFGLTTLPHGPEDSGFFSIQR